jgi:hypothetical protein
MGTSVIARLVRLALLAVLVVSALACRNPPTKKIARLGGENILQSFGADEEIGGLASIAITGKRGFVAWSTGQAVMGMFVGGDGRLRGQAFTVQGSPARFIDVETATSKGKTDAILLLTVPYTSPLEGNKPALLVVLGTDGSSSGPSIPIGEIGPYAMGGALSVNGSSVLAVRHLGKIGDFGVEAEGIDLAQGVLWRKRLSTAGLNAFLPAAAGHGGHHAVAWIEKKMTIGKNAQETLGDLRFTVMDDSGAFVTPPLTVGRTKLADFSPALVMDGSRIRLLFKDHPEDEYRDGLYLSALDVAGKRLSGPVRLARADGPSSPILLALEGGILGTLTLRKLAGDLLIGANLVDERSRKLQRELQVYGHGLKIKSIAGFSIGERMIIVYSGCRVARCGIYTIAMEML